MKDSYPTHKYQFITSCDLAYDVGLGCVIRSSYDVDE
jgi:hypothetical protein